MIGTGNLLPRGLQVPSVNDWPVIYQYQLVMFLFFPGRNGFTSAHEMASIFLKEALSEMHGYGSAPTGSQSAPNHFMAEALGETHTSESRLPPAPTAPNPAPTSFKGSLKRNAWLWAPPRLLFILLNKRRGDPVRLTICPVWGPF